jgi:hypothetical protein
MDVAALHPPDGEEINERTPETISNIVFRPAKPPRVVLNRNFQDTVSFDSGQGRKKPVHPVEDRDFPQTFLLKYPQGAGAVPNRFTAQTVPNRIGNS